MISLFSVQLYFSCISNVFLIWAYPISCLACLCLLYQMVKIQCVAFHRWSWIFSFETSLTSASTRWLWLWWTWWWECWSWPFAGNDCSLYQNTICWQQMIQYVVFHRCSSWIVGFKTGLTSASYQVVMSMIMVMSILIMEIMIMSFIKWSQNDQNTMCCLPQVIFDRQLRDLCFTRLSWLWKDGEWW